MLNEEISIAAHRAKFHENKNKNVLGHFYRIWSILWYQRYYIGFPII